MSSVNYLECFDTSYRLSNFCKQKHSFLIEVEQQIVFNKYVFAITQLIACMSCLQNIVSRDKTKLTILIIIYIFFVILILQLTILELKSFLRCREYTIAILCNSIL